MSKFAPRIYDKKTGETYQVKSIMYLNPLEIYLIENIETEEIVRDADGNSIAYTHSKGLVGTKGWRDIADVVLLLPTLQYDENGEMIYVSSQEGEIKND